MHNRPGTTNKGYLATIRGIEYCAEHFYVNNSSFSYDTIYKTEEKRTITYVNSIRTGTRISMGFYYLSDGKHRFVNLGFSYGIWDLISKRSIRLTELFEWIRKRTKANRMKLLMDQIKTQGYFDLAKGVGFDLNGNIFYKGIHIDNISQALKFNRLSYGAVLTGWFGQPRGRNDYSLTIDTQSSDGLVNIQVTGNKDVFDEIFNVISRQ